MILHFLGLDHIGHVLGALNPTIDKKLLEMDAIIHEMYEKFVKHAKNSENLIIITGDHGMRDAGGHGGSTRDETHVPLILLGLKCERDDRIHDQTDLATTAAVLLGLDVPDTSNGALIPEVLERFNDEQKLRVLNQTSQRLLKKVLLQMGEGQVQDKEFHLQLIEAHDSHQKYLTSKDPVAFMSAALKYAASSQQMRTILTANTVKYDMSTILVATLGAFSVSFDDFIKRS